MVSSSKPQTTPASYSTPKETANWKTYRNTKYNYTFMYPSNYAPYKGGGSIVIASPVDATVLVGNVKAVNSPSGEWLPIFYVNYLSDSNVTSPYNIDLAGANKLLSVPVGNIVQVSGRLFKGLPDTTIGGVNAQVFLNNYLGTNPNEHTTSEEKLFLIKMGVNLYAIGSYIFSNSDQNTLNHILSTFKFTN